MSKNKSRLGRSLSSLLSVSEISVPQAAVPSPEPATNQSPPLLTKPGDGELFHVELSQVTVNPHQPRRNFEQESLQRLADSLRNSGLIQPIVVRAVDGGYQLVAGERRWRAAKLAGLTRLPALLRHVDVAEQAQLALIENLHRTNLNPLERALAYRNLLLQLGLTQEELAERLGEDRSTVANHLRLLDLCEPARAHVASGALSLGHAKLLAGVHDLLLQQQLADRAVVQELSVRKLEALVRSARNDAPPPTSLPAALTPHILDLEKRLSRDLQMRVQVRQAGAKGRGRLVIHYSSLDQFDDLVARLGLHADE